MQYREQRAGTFINATSFNSTRRVRDRFLERGITFKGVIVHTCFICVCISPSEDIFITETFRIAKIHMYLWLWLDRTDISEYERKKRRGKTNTCSYFYLNEFHTPSRLISSAVRVRSKLHLQHFFLPTSIRNERIIDK